MTQFKIYHIDYSTLLSLVNKANTQSTDTELDEYSGKVISVFNTLVCKKNLRLTSNKVAAWQRIGHSANWLFEHHWYEYVANVKANSAIEAIRSTTNIDGFWFINKNVDVHKVSSRNTSSLDILEVDECRYLICTGGFYDLTAFEFISNQELEHANEC